MKAELSADNTRLAPSVRSAKCLDNVTVYSTNTATYYRETLCRGRMPAMFYLQCNVADAGEPVVVTVTDKANNSAE